MIIQDIYVPYKSERELGLEYRFNQINESRLILKKSPEFDQFIKPAYIFNYVESYNKLDERSKMSNQDRDVLTVDNFIEEFQYNFYFDYWLELMSEVRSDIEKEKRHIELLKLFKSFSFAVADVCYFDKFYKEVSLEEQVRAEGFSFNVGIFKPLKRSVLFN